MSAGRVLVVDDDDAFRFAIGKALRRAGFEVLQAASGEEGLAALVAPDPPDVALLDLRMNGMSGLEVLRRRAGSPTRIVVLTGHGTVEAAVEAMQLGAFSFVEKPVDVERLEPLLRQAVDDVRRGLPGRDGVVPLVGRSALMAQVRQFVRTVGPTDETVTIVGETGTGKEVVARHLHEASPRAERPFVAMNAACVPPELFESELFGHKRGAFTGATSDRKGLFREADGGTLFIDEIGELPIELQAKLLRALETRRVRPVGESGEQPVDVRIVAATNRDLWGEVQQGRFREDLYFRLMVFPLVLAPLRDRPEDIEPLAAHLLERLGVRATISPEALAALERYHWPGNVRELLNVLRRASLFASGSEIDGDLAARMIAGSIFGQVAAAPTSQSLTSDLPLAEVERRHIEQVLRAHDGNVTRAAVALGIDRRTLQRKLKTYGHES